MRQLVPVAFVLVLFSLSGCAPDAGALDADAGAREIAARCDEDAGPPYFCLGHAGPICNDQALPPTCVEGAWQCPEGYLPQDEAPPCSCAASTPCLEEGSTCGSCSDSCSACLVLRCESGLWARQVTAEPPPPCTSFECGPELRCAAEREYCAHTLSDVAGTPDAYECLPLPTDCHDCSCMPSPEACEEGGEGGLTLTLGGG